MSDPTPIDRKCIRLSIRDFALPVPLTGSLDTHSGLRERQELGREIHQRIQAQRSLELSKRYEAEKSISGEFEHKDYRILVQGRMDGIVDLEGDLPLIEEIKTTFDVRELRKRLEPRHPYSLQLRTYGYLFYLESGKRPSLQLHLVSSRTQKGEEVEIDLDIEDYREWLAIRLDQIVEEAAASWKRVEKRKRIAKDLPFPFENPRTGQRELIAFVEDGFQKNKDLLLQAPTGLGKTMGVLHPTLKDAFDRGQRVIYITPKNTQHSVAEDALSRLEDKGAKLKSLTMTAKSKLCLKAEPLCSPAYCEFARNYFDKLEESGLREKLARKKKFNSAVFRELGLEHEVCPYELQFEVAASCDVIVGDYHYALNAPGRLTHITGPEAHGMEGDPSLVIDEAHNLPSRAMDAWSSELTTGFLKSIAERAESLKEPFQKELQELAKKGIRILESCGEKSAKEAQRVNPDLDSFVDQESAIRNLMSRYLESDSEVGEKDPVLSLSYAWTDFAEALLIMESQGKSGPFFATFQRDYRGESSVRVVCSDASEFLKPMHDAFHRVVAFSATLKPFEHYRELGGFDPDTTIESEFSSPFQDSNRKLLIIPQVTTRYSERSRSAPKIAEAIRRISQVKQGNYFVFFPSFEFLELVLGQFDPPPGFTVLRQDRRMGAADIESVVTHLREGIIPTLVFAVQGGVLSEGVDYPGDTIIGAFIVGPPLPAWNIEQQGRREFFEKRFGQGMHHASTWPAMAKAVQAAGRVIRTETDRGLIVLFDDRFLEKDYATAMPRGWFKSSPRELISQSILSEVEQFWSGSARP